VYDSSPTASVCRALKLLSSALITAVPLLSKTDARNKFMADSRLGRTYAASDHIPALIQRGASIHVFTAVEMVVDFRSGSNHPPI